MENISRRRGRRRDRWLTKYSNLSQPHCQYLMLGHDDSVLNEEPKEGYTASMPLNCDPAILSISPASRAAASLLNFQARPSRVSEVCPGKQ